jgi:hypothetical protein
MILVQGALARTAAITEWSRFRDPISAMDPMASQRFR